MKNMFLLHHVLLPTTALLQSIMGTKKTKKAMTSHPTADISPENLVVRFSESVDGFPLPKGHSVNPELAAPQKEGAEAFLKDRS